MSVLIKLCKCDFTFAKIIQGGFVLQKLLTLLLQKKHIIYLTCNVSLTDDVVSFKQLGPGCLNLQHIHFS